MVKTAIIKQSNARFASEQHVGRVCVFVGATSGIGAGTLEKMVQQLQNSTFYVLGRSKARFAAQRAKLESLNPSCKLIFIESEVSLLCDVDAACRQITAAEDKVDYLYMSAGLVPFNGAQYTKEGLETCFVISYYARIRLVCNLLPLLRRSTRPRILSVLNGGKEGSLQEQDLGLERSWSAMSVVNHTTTMMTISFEHLAAQEPQMTFMHSYPGLVKTDIFTRLTPPAGSGIVWRVALASLRGFVAVLMMFFGLFARGLWRETDLFVDKRQIRSGSLADQLVVRRSFCSRCVKAVQRRLMAGANLGAYYAHLRERLLM